MNTNIVKSIDIYSSQFNFKFLNDTKYKSVGGGIMTILTIIPIILLFLIFSEDFYFRKNPRYINQQIEDLNDTLYEINENLLFGEVRLEDENRNPVNYTGYLSFDFQCFSYIKTINENKLISFETLITVSITRLNCSKYDLTKMKMKTDMNFSNLECLNFNNLSLRGSWIRPYVRNVTINLKKCIKENEPKLHFFCY